MNETLYCSPRRHASALITQRDFNWFAAEVEDVLRTRVFGKAIAGMVPKWEGIISRQRTSLVIFNGNLTALRYLDNILRPVLVQFQQVKVDVTTFQQDNGTRLTQDFLRQKNVNVTH